MTPQIKAYSDWTETIRSANANKQFESYKRIALDSVHGAKPSF